MKLLVQRVSQASVSVHNHCIGQIQAGLLVFVGCQWGDTERDADYLAQKLVALRVFKDEQDKMNRSLQQIEGSALIISQFTLYADTRKGNRPSFIQSDAPAHAEQLYQYVIQRVQSLLSPERVATGQFGADMQVSLVNDGPVTIELSSDSQPWHRTQYAPNPQPSSVS